jgi:hypothetical protein
MVQVGDRGMLNTARIRALKEVGGLGWVTALRAPQIAALAADTGPLQMSLFDQQNFAEIAHPDYPGERLIACRNPALAELRTRKRLELLAATEALLAPIQSAVAAGRLVGADNIGRRVGRVQGKHKVGKHFQITITDTTMTVTRDQAKIDAEAALDGIYVIRGTPIADALDTPGMIRAYKALTNVEKDFRSIKTIDIDLRPVYHHLEHRVRGHVFLCFLAAHLTWHLRRTLAELIYTDENPVTRDDPVAPAIRSQAAKTKLSTRTSTTGLPLHTYQGLLDHLATLTRNDIQYGGNGPVVPTLAEPTPVQRRVFDLLGAPIPTSLD